MKKRVLLLVSACVISAVKAAGEWPSPEKKKEKWQATKSVPNSPVGRPSTDSFSGSLSVSPKKIASVQEPQAYNVQFENSDELVEVPFSYPFPVLKRMTSGLGALRHRFDAIHFRGDGAQCLKDLMAFYDDPNEFVADLYSGQRQVDLNGLVYLAGLLAADNFANTFYVALLNHQKNKSTIFKRETNLQGVLKELGVEELLVTLPVSLNPADVASISNHQSRGEESTLQAARRRARALLKEFG